MTAPLYCPTKARHKLAERRVTPDGVVLDARLAAPGRRGYVVSSWTPLDAAAFTDGEGDVLSSETRAVGCRCGRWSADLAAMWRGEPVDLEPIAISRREEPEDFGLSPDRSRHARDEE